MSALVSVPPYGILEPSANYCSGEAREDGEDAGMLQQGGLTGGACSFCDSYNSLP